MSDFDISFILVNIYDPSSMQDKLKILTKLSHVIQSQESSSVIVVGDFNAILDHSEKSSGIFPPIKIIQDFSYVVDNNNLMKDIPS